MAVVVIIVLGLYYQVTNLGFWKEGFVLFGVREEQQEFSLTTPTFSETTPIKSPVNLVYVRSHGK